MHIYSIPPYVNFGKHMAHLKRSSSNLISRLRRIKGQVEGVERALEREADCTEILRQLASIRGAMNGLTNEVLQDHLRTHVVDAPDDATRQAGAEEIIQVLKTYLK